MEDIPIIRVRRDMKPGKDCSPEDMSKAINLWMIAMRLYGDDMDTVILRCTDDNLPTTRFLSDICRESFALSIGTRVPNKEINKRTKKTVKVSDFEIKRLIPL